MRNFALSAVTFSLAAALLAGCGASQPPIGAPGAILHSSAKAPSASYRLLYSFNGEGSSPSASLISVNGTLYGTTLSGGYDGFTGTVFSTTTTGMLRFLAFFGLPPDASNPAASLISLNGTLYGTTEYGGRFGSDHGKKGGNGTVFSISTSGTVNVLHSFRGRNDGVHPLASLIDIGGTLYGTTRDGGTKQEGTVFEISTSGRERVLHSFYFSGGSSSDGSEPCASLIDVNGTLYGTTSGGGAYGHGTVFSITTTGTEHVLYSFGGSASDGSEPHASLIDVHGTLYGTTEFGGTYGWGTVFSTSTSGTEHVLHTFAGGSDGAAPAAGLIDVKGTLYGTTRDGGGSSCGSNGCGTVFSVTTGGKEQVLYAFTSSDGAWPVAGLINVNGTLYGTTLGGGEIGNGTVFAFTP
ncbi:MAG: choice-of-anchor tandem repeat GloVer-containing protein [Candidatus Cybelea sp.]